jgi:hypothetical protein
VHLDARKLAFSARPSAAKQVGNFLDGCAAFVTHQHFGAGRARQ